MKKITFLILGIFFYIPSSIFSQVNIDQNKDVLTRASYASFYIEESSEEYFNGYTTPYGEGCANIILKNFRDLLPIPEISNLTINGNDKIKIEMLVKKLNILRENPPSWEDIYKLEEQRLIQWDKAIRQKSKYK